MRAFERMRGPPPLFIDTKRGEVHVRREEEVVVSPRIGGAQQMSIVVSTLWGMVPGVAVILGIILGLAEIAPASWQLQRAAWWLM